MKIICCTVFSIIVICLYSSCSAEDDFKLELLQVLFRHGDRTPEEIETYETDPYGAIFKKIGYGKLTKIGMQRAYQIGKILRQQYGYFLDDYLDKDVYARSTNIVRTKMSLQLVLAGLYPPTNKRIWNKELLWSPIPTYYRPKKMDFLFSFMMCPSYRKMHDKYKNEDLKNANISQSFKDHILNSTGSTSYYYIFNNLRSALSMGLPLPDWCSAENYKELKRINGITFRASTKTTQMGKIAAGPVVREFLKNIKNHENGRGANKIYLYSVHDSNVGAFTNVHNFTGIPSSPDFCSTVIVEKLRGPDNQVYLRMFLWTGTTEQWIPLKMPNCSNECRLSEYSKRMEWVLPDSESGICI